MLITLTDADGKPFVIEIDGAQVVAFGGFGSIYQIVNDPSFILKEVPFSPRPLGDSQMYVAHIRMTRDRLLEIRDAERRRAMPRKFILESIDEIVDRVLSTHWGFRRKGMEIDAVWFRQRKARGRELSALFKEPAPAPAVRVKIALCLVARMRTLRRAGLVHLDCVPANVFVDGTHATPIDLDGSGIVRRGDPTTHGVDEWDHRPLTLGHLSSVRPPPWYPQVGCEFSPKGGNYLFAERWVVVDTIIRILSWDRVRGALSWIGSEARQLVAAYGTLRSEIDSARAAGGGITQSAWSTRYQQMIDELRAEIGPLSTFVIHADQPRCLQRFADLAQAAFFDPIRLASAKGEPPPYDTYRDWLRG